MGRIKTATEEVVPVTIRMPKSLHEAMHGVAAKERRSITSIVILGVELYVRQAAEKEGA